MKITDTIYQVDDVTGSPTVIAGDGTLTVVDAGLPDSGPKILGLIESLGHKPSDIKQILLTHSDGDHIGALADLVAASGAKVYAQREEAEVIEGKRKSRGGQIVRTPVHVDQIVKDGDVLPIHGGIRVVESFGHTLGHVAYYLESQKFLIAGDAIANHGGLSLSPPAYMYNADDAKGSARKLAALAPEGACFGHGEPIPAGAAAQLNAFAKTL
jgi:glyoxylase-like metal-dependent hydrolase (beta-lactamase superfamily II)